MNVSRCPHCDALIPAMDGRSAEDVRCPRCNGSLTVARKRSKSVAKSARKKQQRRRDAPPVSIPVAEDTDVDWFGEGAGATPQGARVGKETPPPEAESDTYSLATPVDERVPSADDEQTPAYALAPLPEPRPVVPVEEHSVSEALAGLRIKPDPPPPPPAHPFLTGVFSFPWYRQSVFPWFFLSLFFALSFSLFGFALSLKGTYAVAFGLVCFGLAGVAIGAWGLCYGTSNCLWVVTETAAGYDKIDQWPAMDIRESLIQTLQQFYLWSIASLLAFVFAKIVLPNSAPPELQAGLLVAGMAAFYPFLLLSSLECDSTLVPFSQPVFRSLARLAGSWLVFYAEMAFVCLGTFFTADILLRTLGALGAPLLGPMFATLMLLSARLIGRMGSRLVLCGDILVEPHPDDKSP